MQNKIIPRTQPNCIRQYRKKRNLRIKDVAELMELRSPGHIAHWEKNRKLPNLVNALKLAAAIDCMVEVMYSDLFKQIRHDVFIKKQIRKGHNQLPLL